MIARIDIENYRCFDRLQIEGLTRVNLFVGRNNSGKTTVLEAIEALVSQDSPFILYRASHERGETRSRPGTASHNGVQIEVRHWFSGHDLRVGAFFRLRADDGQALEVVRGIEPVPPDAPSPPFVPTGYMLTIQRPRSRSTLGPLPLTADGYLGAGSPVEWTQHAALAMPRVLSISTARLTALELQRLWDAVVLTPSESLVTESLRLIDPAVERVAPAGSLAEAPQFLVLLHGTSAPVPLGSLGEGVSRMFAIALGLAVCRGGVLLIDEIEIGLHHTTHVDLWRLVAETANKLDVQVFATTHSRDCLEGIAELFRRDPDVAEAISVHRLELGQSDAVRMDARTIAGTVDGGVEIR
jgi:ABC-type transport system involved in cytochrome c biogenesis ATPase subunit